MRILFCNQNFALGGVERRLSQLIYGLSQQGGYELYCLVFDETKVYPILNKTNLKIFKIPEGGRKTKLNFIDSVIKDIKPDIVHCWNLEMAFLCAITKFRKNYGFKLISGTITTAYKYPKNKATFYIEKFTFKQSDVIVSNSLAGIVVKNAPRKKCRVIYNGFDYQRLSNLRDPGSIRMELGINTPYIITKAARVNEQKDIKTFIDVAKVINDKRADTTFVLVGDGTHLNYYKEYARSQNITNLLFTGLRKDVENIMNASTICMQCSKHPEGLSNSIMEACAIGRPVVATDSGGTKEIIEEGKNGFILGNGDVYGLSEKVSYLLDNPDLISRMGEYSKQVINERFLLDTMVHNYIDLYKTI